MVHAQPCSPRSLLRRRAWRPSPASRARTASRKPSRLWYDRPAAAFEEALPLGNGRTGAMVYGGPASDRFLLNDSTLWTGGPIDPAVNPDAINWLPKVREALFKGDYKAADALTRKIQGKFSQSYAPLGDLYIDAPGLDAAQVTGYRRELDLATAVTHTTFTAGGARFSREAFVSYPDKLLIVRLTASEPGRLTVALRFTSQLRHEVTVAANGDLLLSGRAPVHAEPNYRRDIKDPFVYDEGPNPKGTRFAARARILSTDGRVGRGAGTITLEGATTALVAVAIDTSFAGFDRDPAEGPDPVPATATRLDGSRGAHASRACGRRTRRTSARCSGGSVSTSAARRRTGSRPTSACASMRPARRTRGSRRSTSSSAATCSSAVRGRAALR